MGVEFKVEVNHPHMSMAYLAVIQTIVWLSMIDLPKSAF